MRLIDADRLLSDRMKKMYYHLPNGDIAIPLIDIEHAPTAQPEQRWIPCSEKLPEDDTEVFVYLFDRPSPFIAWIEDCHWYTEEFEVEKDNYPLAWMPLPEPYEERRER